MALVTIDGQPASGLFQERLVSVTVRDNEGLSSDSIELTFDDSSPHFMAPRRGAEIALTFLVDGQAFVMGTFIADKVTNFCLPYKITVRGHSADLRAEMKTSRTRHWSGKSVAEIVREIATDHSLSPKISEAVSSHVYPWIAQQDETDLQFLNRLAERHGALFSIKGGSLLWLQRGTGTAQDGNVVPTLFIDANELIVGSFQRSESDVDRYAKIKAYWQDREGARRREVTVRADDQAAGEHVLSEVFSSAEEAFAAAKAAAQEMIRGQTELNFRCLGRPDILAGMPVSFLDVHPDIGGNVYIVDGVEHSFSKNQGLVTHVRGKAQVAV